MWSGSVSQIGESLGGGLLQVEVHNVEAYHYDGECLAKADEMRKTGVLVIKQLQVRLGRCYSTTLC